jgi:CRISPR/Cas system endoribonuclease Cas6 (RAMP superfamily)
VLRAAALDGLAFQSGEEFSLDLNFFDLAESLPDTFATVFQQLEWTGLGPRRPRISLEAVESQAPVVVDRAAATASRLRVEFITPTELKFQGSVLQEPRFDVLFARARDRVSQLCELYQGGPLDIDFRAMGERSRTVRLVRHNVRQAGSSRKSTRTGQRHELGGFVGEAEFEGDLSEFLPILRAACWTGVGRHTVWGLGAIDVKVLG